MARDLEDCIVIDDSEDEELPLDVPSDPCNNHDPGSCPNSGPSCGRSPLAAQQEPRQQSSRQLEASAARQLYAARPADSSCLLDEAATAAREEQLRRTGKAPAAGQQQGRVKAEEGSTQQQQDPSEDDIAALQAELLLNPELQLQLEQGEGSSSNPRHIWRQRVYRALVEQQAALLSQTQLRGERDSVDLVITDSEDEDGEEEQQPAPPKKKQRTMPSSSAAAGAGAGSSRQAPAKQRMPQQEQEQEQEQQPRKRQRQQQQQQQDDDAGPSRQPPQRPPRAPSRPQPGGSRNNAAAAAAAAAGGGSSGSDPAPGADRVAQRALRAQLSRLDASVAARHDELVDSSITALPGMLLKLQDLNDQTTRAREAAIGAGVLENFCKLGVELIHNFSNERRGRDPAQLVAAVRRTCARDARGAADGPAAIDWALIGQAASARGMFRTAPGVGSMLGALEGQAKVRKVAVRQRRAQIEPEVRPVVGDAALQQDHGLGQETERVVTDMRRVIGGAGCCGVVALVLDHESFAHTVENMFALSFLCKDMFCALEEDKQHGLLVRHITRERQAQLKREAEAAAAAGDAGRLTPHQFMMQLDMPLWRDMKAVVGPDQTLMPPRARVAH